MYLHFPASRIRDRDSTQCFQTTAWLVKEERGATEAEEERGNRNPSLQSLVASGYYQKDFAIYFISLKK